MPRGSTESTRLTRQLQTAGFDLVHGFSAAGVAQQTGFALELFGRSDALAFLVGHTRALWAPFLRHYQQAAASSSASAPGELHPLDDYTELVLLDACSRLGVSHRMYFGHRAEQRLPLQRIADAAGFAELSPSFLSIHPRFGPWVGLRAVVVIDQPPGALPAPLEPRHCPGCSAPCRPAFESAVLASPGGAPTLDSGSWKAWLAVRDSCPIGRQWRYTEPQIRYHYTKNQDILANR